MVSERMCSGPGCSARPGYLDDSGLCAACASIPMHTRIHIRTLEEKIEQLRVQLAGCSVAALGGTNNPASVGDYGWSLAYEDTLRLRRSFDELLAALREAISSDLPMTDPLKLLSAWEKVISNMPGA